MKTKQEKIFERNWTPVKRGHIYCSSACGANCTLDAFEKAHKDAKKLVRVLNKTKKLNDSWIYEVHENLGWHYTVFSPGGNISVGSFNKEYSAIVNNRFLGHEKTPAEAVENAIAECTKEFNHLSKVLQNL